MLRAAQKVPPERIGPALIRAFCASVGPVNASADASGAKIFCLRAALPC
jgi:hypothetical protein